MTSKRCIAKLTRALKEKLPVTLEKNLIASSFDSEASILGIDSEIIKEIELFVNQNQHILENTEYEEVLKTKSEFKFKPGHKSALKLLPNALRDYNNKQKITQDEESLKTKLINKLAKFSENNLLGLLFEESLITNYRVEQDKSKCKIECPICSTQFTCYYSTYWCASNFEKHIKKHFVAVEVVPENTIKQSNQIIAYVNNDDIESISD